MCTWASTIPLVTGVKGWKEPKRLGGSEGKQCAHTCWELSVMKRKEGRAQRHPNPESKYLTSGLKGDTHIGVPQPQLHLQSLQTPEWAHGSVCLFVPLLWPTFHRCLSTSGGQGGPSWSHHAIWLILNPGGICAGEAVTENHVFTASASCPITLLLSTHHWTFTEAEFLEALVNAKSVYGMFSPVLRWLWIHLQSGSQHSGELRLQETGYLTVTEVTWRQWLETNATSTGQCFTALLRPRSVCPDLGTGCVRSLIPSCPAFNGHLVPRLHKLPFRCAYTLWGICKNARTSQLPP